MGKASRRKKRSILVMTDRPAGGRTENNYMKKLLLMQEGGLLGAPGEIREVTIGHDDECHTFAGGFCDCNPTISVGLPLD